MDIATRVRDTRIELELTQRELGRRCGLHQATISAIEKGVVKGTLKIAMLADALGVNVDWLVSGQGDKQRKKSMAVHYPPTISNVLSISKKNQEDVNTVIALIDEHGTQVILKMTEKACNNLVNMLINRAKDRI